MVIYLLLRGNFKGLNSAGGVFPKNLVAFVSSHISKASKLVMCQAWSSDILSLRWTKAVMCIEGYRRGVTSGRGLYLLMDLHLEVAWGKNDS